MTMIERVNQNPGVAAVAAILIGFTVLIIVVALLLRRQARRTAAMFRRLDERMMGGNGRLRASVRALTDTMGAAAANLSAASDSMETRQERMRREMEDKLDAMRESSDHKLDEMRVSLGTSMQKTLEARLGESFRLVSGQLENVYRGLGEMQTLTQGVGDLKRVLTGVKTRGVWGEARLRALITENLTPSQFAENVEIVPGSGERVEFAVRLPGKAEDAPVWLPVDSKFPMEDYQRLVEVAESGDAKETARCGQALENALTEQAKRIHSKYIRVPHSTDFAVMFLPTESLYGEALSRRGLAEKLQSAYHVLPAGPTSFAALLSCLQMGFQTVAMEKRSGEILRMLGGVKQEFARFGETLTKARARLEQAAGDLDSVGARTRALNRRLSELETDSDPTDSPDR